MSDKIKEARELLEDAQKAVLKTLNSETSFLTRLFSGSAKDRLKIAQSSISKAMNQIKDLREGEGSTAGKLQKHISERDDRIKDFEAKLKQKTQETSSLEDKIRQLESKITDLEKSPEQKESSSQKTPEEDNSPSLEDNLRETIEKLESKTLFLTEKLDQNKKELKDSGDLILEFSNRMKRLKAEITSK